jgi:carboxypeptidase C (cathepsin A)
VVSTFSITTRRAYSLLALQSTTEEAAIDAAALSFVFFEHFSELKGNAFHMSGESYGGRYIPLFASAVHDLNPRLVKAGFDAVNLSSVLIGNGMTDFATMVPSYFDMQCTPASVAPIQDIRFLFLPGFPRRPGS